jgi:hypothetical protein
MQNVIYLSDDATDEELRELVEEQKLYRTLGISDETARIVDNRSKGAEGALLPDEALTGPRFTF